MTVNFTAALIFACLFALIINSGVAQSKEEKLNDIMKAYYNYNMFDGSVLVTEDGKIIYKAAFGFANREWDIPNTTNTKFMIGSVSKPFTAVLILIQVQKGLINLDKTISDYLPEFSNKDLVMLTMGNVYLALNRKAKR